MSSSEPKNPNRSVESPRHPPPMPLSPDLQIMGTPGEPIGLPDHPIRDGQRFSKPSRWKWIVFMLVAAAAFALFLWFACRS